MQTYSPVLNEKEAARYIGMSVSYLQKDRSTGTIAKRTPGPCYAKLGSRVVYRRTDLDAWIEENVVSQMI